jgi:hypothetical protein
MTPKILPSLLWAAGSLMLDDAHHVISTIIRREKATDTVAF